MIALRNLYKTFRLLLCSKHVPIDDFVDLLKKVDWHERSAKVDLSSNTLIVFNLQATIQNL